MRVSIDHVVYLVRDLDEAASRLGAALGVSFGLRGTHPQGTVNRVFKFDDLSYVELLAATPGSLIAERIERLLDERGEHVARWAVRCDPEEIGVLADMLDLTTQPGSIERDDGARGSWTIANSVDDDARGSPFLIAYDEDIGSREERLARDGSVDGRLTWIECSGASIEPWRNLIEGIDVRPVAGEHDRVTRVGLRVNGVDHVLPLK